MFLCFLSVIFECSDLSGPVIAIGMPFSVTKLYSLDIANAVNRHSVVVVNNLF